MNVDKEPITFKRELFNEYNTKDQEQFLPKMGFLWQRMLFHLSVSIVFNTAFATFIHARVTIHMNQ